MVEAARVASGFLGGHTHESVVLYNWLVGVISIEVIRIVVLRFCLISTPLITQPLNTLIQILLFP